MNLAHIHLILNHIPIVGIPVALAFLIYGIYVKNQHSQRFALFMLMGLATVVLPVYFTGEPAEEVVEHLPGVAESFIEAHEDAATFSLVLTLTTGAAAFAALWFQKDPKKIRLMNFGVMGFAILAFLSLLYTANLGGKVRHTELRSSVGTQKDRFRKCAYGMCKPRGAERGVTPFIYPPSITSCHESVTKTAS